MAIHHLKTWPTQFQAIKRGEKTFEMRRCDDRTFTEGDILILQEWDPCAGSGAYTGDRLTFMAGYILRGGQPEWGCGELAPGVCIISLAAMPDMVPDCADPQAEIPAGDLHPDVARRLGFMLEAAE
jgi:hypothetical protein